MKHLKKFEGNNAYNQFKKSPNYVWPNVSKIDIDLSSFTMDYHKEENNIIRYWAPSKLPETTSNKSGGLHTDKFNTTITEHTFENGMGVIKFANNVTELIGTNNQGEYGAFGNSNITHIILPNTITNIGRCSFYKCQSLINIELSSILKSIGYDAFNTCNNLLSIKLPDTVESIGQSAFIGCSNLTSIKLSESLISIGGYAFDGCSSLTSLIIPKNVTSIGTAQFGSFQNCSSLTSIKVHPNNTIYNSNNNCNAIIKTNTNELVQGCKNTIIPSNITKICNHAFSGCTSITSISLHEGITNIGINAFYRCTGLTSIILPSTINFIDDYAFENCSNLTSITINAIEVPELDESVFDNTNNCPIYVPAESVDAYKAAEEWSNYASRIQAIPE